MKSGLPASNQYAQNLRLFRAAFPFANARRGAALFFRDRLLLAFLRQGLRRAGMFITKGEVAMPELRTKEVEDLLEVFAGLTDPNDVFALLEDLFTVREIKDTSQRLDVARMLRKGSSYAVIEKATGASATTIARVSKALNYGAGGYALAFDVLDALEADDSQATGNGSAAEAVRE